jgi:hypothetical protein
VDGFCDIAIGQRIQSSIEPIYDGWFGESAKRSRVAEEADSADFAVSGRSIPKGGSSGCNIPAGWASREGDAVNRLQPGFAFNIPVDPAAPHRLKAA